MMYEPCEGILVPSTLKVRANNAKYLKNESCHRKIVEKKGKGKNQDDEELEELTEYFDLVQLFLSNSVHSGRPASEALTKGVYHLSDYHISTGNVLHLKLHKFERFFVFTNENFTAEDSRLFVQHDHFASEKLLQNFLKALNILIKQLSIIDKHLHGQIP